MPVVTVRLPEAKESPALKRLTSQFADLQKSVLAKSAPASGSEGKVLTALLKQQDAMLKAIERLMAHRGQASPSMPGMDALADTLKGLKKVLAGLPGDLKGAMKSSMQHQVATKRPSITVKPQVTVTVPGEKARMSQMNELIAAVKKSRNRTFGSNY